MSQPDYNFTEWGTNATSTGQINIKSGPGFLHAVNIMSSGTGSFILYNATTSSTGNEIGVFTVGAPNSFIFDIQLSNGLCRSNTTSTAEVNVTWA